MPVKPCLVCGALGNSSRCPTHTYRNGSTRAWRATRRRILKRDNYTCQHCGREDWQLGPDERMHVDHLTPKVNGGTDHPANLNAACSTCNLSKGEAQ